jgi:DMSO reductase anchor subunit
MLASAESFPAHSKSLRIRYAAGGLIVGVILIGAGQTGLPMWVDALSFLAMFVVVLPLIRLTRRQEARAAGVAVPLFRRIALRVVFLAIGVIGGGLVSYALVPVDAEGSVLRTVVARLVLLVVSIPLQLRVARRRASAASAANISPAKRLVPWRLIVAKIVLLGVGLGLAGLLTRWTSHADILVAVLLVLAGALAGPTVHRYLFIPVTSQDDSFSASAEQSLRTRNPGVLQPADEG